MVYLHPWQVDVKQSRLKRSWKSELRRRFNLKTTMEKLRRLLIEFRFKPLSNLLAGPDAAKSA
jgi:Domain of unknown function (DUF3473)